MGYGVWSETGFLTQLLCGCAVLQQAKQPAGLVSGHGVARNRSVSQGLITVALTWADPQKGTIMSAPQTNIEKQKRWHRGPLIGMAVVAIFGVAMLFFWLMDEAKNGDSPTKSPEASESTEPAGTVPAPAVPVPAN